MSRVIVGIWKRGKACVSLVLLVAAVSCAALLCVMAQEGGHTLPADYAVFYGLDPASTNDVEGDCDSDGLANWQEALLNSDPTCQDTDGDGVLDGVDPDPVSAANLLFGSTYPLTLTTNEEYEVQFGQPQWLLGAFQESTNDTGRLTLAVDRNIVTQDMVLRLNYLDTPAFLGLTLVNSNAVVVTNLPGNILTGTSTQLTNYVAVPLAAYPDAAGIQLWRGTGEVAVYEANLSIAMAGTNTPPAGGGSTNQPAGGTNEVPEPPVPPEPLVIQNLPAQNVRGYSATFAGNLLDLAGGETIAASFDSSLQQLLSAVDSDNISLTGTDFTLSIWAYMTRKQACTLVGKFGSSSSKREYWLGTDGGAYDWWCGAVSKGYGSWSTVNAYTVTPLQAGKWYHVVFSRSTTATKKIWVNNGTNSHSSASSGGYNNNTNNLLLGGTIGANYYLNGRLAMYGFWKRELTADERTFLYNNGNGRLYNELSSGLKDSKFKAYWDLSEMSGTRYDSHGTNHLLDVGGVTAAAGPGSRMNVRLYWGPADGGTNAGAWENVVDLGCRQVGPIAVDRTNLTLLTTYYYRYMAENPSGTWWAPSTEVFTTTATDADMDRDGMPDDWETANGVTDPAGDPDGDGVSDGQEVNAYGTNPTSPDSDGDGIMDGVEVSMGLNAARLDSDGDGMADGWEMANGLRPSESDGHLDKDGDGVLNIIEYIARTNPNDPPASTPSPTPPPEDQVDVELVLGDPYHSCSEAWSMTCMGDDGGFTVLFTNPAPGDITTQVVAFASGNVYDLGLKWVSGMSDFDHAARIDGFGDRVDGDPVPPMCCGRIYTNTAKNYFILDYSKLLGVYHTHTMFTPNITTNQFATTSGYNPRIIRLVFPKLELLNATDYFTPRQAESPPYHVAKADYIVPTNLIAKLSITNLVFEVKEKTNSWSNIFYRAIIPCSNSALPDTKLYTITNRYCVTNLYAGTNVERVCWDGRKDADGDGNTDTDADGNEIWADRPANTAADDEKFDVRVGYAFEVPCTVGTHPTTTNFFYSNEKETRTCPLQLDSDDLPMMGPAPYFGMFRGEINSRYDTVSLSSPAMGPRSDGRPVPEFACYYSGNNWGHTPMAFGWTHNYEVKVLPVYVDGVRKLYLLWNGDHLLGPVDDAGHVWIFGEQADVVETPGSGWTVTTRVHTVLTFDGFGQLSEIKDRNENKVKITPEAFGSGIMIKKIKTVEHLPQSGGAGPLLKLELAYGGVDNTLLTNATLGERSITFAYKEATDVYGTPYPADEVIDKITDPQLDVYEYVMADGMRANQASRIIPGEMKSRQTGGIKINYGYATPENVATLVSQSVVDDWCMGLAAPYWKNTDIIGSTATYGNGTVITHAYTLNKLQSISVAGSGGTATYNYEYSPEGQRIKQTTADGDLVYAYTGPGNLQTITRPSPANVFTYAYGACNQVENWKSATPSREIVYTLDSKGNVTETTEKGETGLPDRAWESPRNMDGSVISVTDPKGIVATHGYSDNQLGLPDLITRSGVNLVNCTHDLFGNVSIDYDEEDYGTYHYYDNLDRPIRTMFRDEEVETFEYRPLLNDLSRHTVPPGMSSQPNTVVLYEFHANGKPKKHFVSGYGVNQIYDYESGTDDDGNIVALNVSDSLSSYNRSYTYDYLDRQTSEHWAGTLKWRRTFDPVGNILTAEDGGGNVHTWTYYGDNSPHVHTRPGGLALGGLGQETWTRDGLGNVLTHVDKPGTGFATPDAITVNTLIDRFDRIRKTKDPRGNEWKFTYDVLDNLTNTVTPLGHAWSASYDAREYRAGATCPDGTGISETRDDRNYVRDLKDAKGVHWESTPNAMGDSLGIKPVTAKSYGKDGPDVRNTYGQVTEGKVGDLAYSRTLNGLGQQIEYKPPYGQNSLTMTRDVCMVRHVDLRDSSKVDITPRADGSREKASVSKTGLPAIETDITENGNGQVAAGKVHNVLSGAGFDRDSVLAYDGWGLPKKVDLGPYVTTVVRDGHMNVVSVSAPSLAMAMTYDENGNLKTKTTNLRTVTYDYDANNNLKLISPPGLLTIELLYDSQDVIDVRICKESGVEYRREKFLKNENGTITGRQFIKDGVVVRTETFDREDTDRLASIIFDDVAREFEYTAAHRIAKDAMEQKWLAGYKNGLLDSSAASPEFTYNRNNEGDIEDVSKAGSMIYDMTLGVAGQLRGIDDSCGYPGGTVSITYEPDQTGHLWFRNLPFGVRQEQVVNDLDQVTKSVLTVAGVPHEVVINRPDGVKIDTITRPGSAPASVFGYNPNQEITSISQGTAGVSLGRKADTGKIRTRSLGYVGATDTYDYNAMGWLTSESRSDGSFTAEYQYDCVGRRTNTVINGRAEKMTFAKAKNPTAYIDGDVYEVGAGCAYTTIEDALLAICAARGTNTFMEPAQIVVKDATYTAPVTASSLLGSLHPTSDNPMIIRGSRTGTVEFIGSVTVQGIEHVRLMNTRVRGALRFEAAPSATLSGCVVDGGVVFTNCPAAVVAGNTFNYAGGASRLEILDCTNAVLCNNVVLNNGLVSGLLVAGAEPLAERNCWWPLATTLPGETNSLNLDPLLAVDTFVPASNSPVVKAGMPLPGLRTAYMGLLRSGVAPCIGACERFDRGTPAGEETPYAVVWDVARGASAVAPVDGTLYRVGSGQPYATIEGALAAIWTNCATNEFTSPAVILLPTGTYGDLAITNTALRPSSLNQLIIRAKPENKVVFTGTVAIAGVPNVRLQALWLQGGVSCTDATGPSLVSCVVTSTVALANCTDAVMLGNTFDYTTGVHRLEIVASAGTVFRDNVVLNDGLSSGISGVLSGSDYNCWWPSNALCPIDAHGVYADPLLLPAESYRIAGPASPVVAAGQGHTNLVADIRGFVRHPGSPCMGAYEVVVDDMGAGGRDGSGRLRRRVVGGRGIQFWHDGKGRLTRWKKDGLPFEEGRYEYDDWTRRTGLTVTKGSETTNYRFVYGAHEDVVAEYVDTDGNPATVERYRLYWLLDNVDQRVGFVDFVGGVPEFYYYLTDHAGTVLQIVDEAGTVVNQYDYDAWGNVLWNSEKTFEGVENRYLFQGREWDSGARHYYYRHRTYLPERGVFLGPDMNLARGILGELEGSCSHTFCSNDPVNKSDPTGLELLGNGRWKVEKGENLSAIYRKLREKHHYSFSEQEFLSRVQANMNLPDLNTLTPGQIIDFHKPVVVAPAAVKNPSVPSSLPKTQLTTGKASRQAFIGLGGTYGGHAVIYGRDAVTGWIVNLDSGDVNNIEVVSHRLGPGLGGDVSMVLLVGFNASNVSDFERLRPSGFDWQADLGGKWADAIKSAGNIRKVTEALKQLERMRAAKKTIKNLKELDEYKKSQEFIRKLQESKDLQDQLGDGEPVFLVIGVPFAGTGAEVSVYYKWGRIYVFPANPF